MKSTIPFAPRAEYIVPLHEKKTRLEAPEVDLNAALFEKIALKNFLQCQSKEVTCPAVTSSNDISGLPSPLLKLSNVTIRCKVPLRYLEQIHFDRWLSMRVLIETIPVSCWIQGEESRSLMSRTFSFE